MQQEVISKTAKSIGRPTVLTDDTVAKLSEALQRGFSVQAACSWAQIDRATFYRHSQSDPIFATKMCYAMNFLYLAATDVIYHKILAEKDSKIAMWYLEKTDPERYGKKKQCKKCHNLQQRYSSRQIYYAAKDYAVDPSAS